MAGRPRIGREVRDSFLSVRLEPSARMLLEQAAKATGVSLSVYVTETTTRAAKRALRERSKKA